jgi:hypothetical protein
MVGRTRSLKEMLLQMRLGSSSLINKEITEVTVKGTEFPRPEESPVLKSTG